MDGSDMQSDKPAAKLFDRHFMKTMETLGQASLSVRAEKDRMIKLVEDYLEGLQKLKSLEGSSRLTACNNNAENESAVANSTRTGRKAAQIANMKVKKNLNFPLKLRRPTTSDDIEVPMTKTCAPLTEVTNGQSRTRSTSKFNRSEVPRRPDMDALNQKQQISEVNAPVDNVADENNFQTPPGQNQPSNINSQSSASGPLSIVKLRTKQFENLAFKTEESVKKTLFGISNDGEKPLALPPASQEDRDKCTVSEIAENEKNVRVVLQRISPLHEAVQPSEQQETPIKQDRNGTFVVQPVATAAAANNTASSSASNIAENESHRVTRAMALSGKLLKSDEATTSEESTSSIKSSRTRGKKRSAVTVKCKRSFKNAKLTRSLKKKTKLKGETKDIRRDREEKMNKAKEAFLRKQEEAKAAQEKKAEKIRAIAAEREKFLKEEEAKKAAIAKQKKLQVEERRKREEAARLARLEEIEEEHKRAEAAIQKKKEQTEALRQKKLAQEIKTTKPLLQDKEKPTTPNMNKKKLAKGNVTQTVAESYEITPDRANRVLENPKNAQNYGIDEAGSSDSSEDEDHPKKRIPAWAERKNRMLPIKINSYVPLAEWNQLYKPDHRPDIKKLLGVDCKRARTSSAIWTTPPLRQ